MEFELADDGYGGVLASFVIWSGVERDNRNVFEQAPEAVEVAIRKSHESEKDDHVGFFEVKIKQENAELIETIEEETLEVLLERVVTLDSNRCAVVDSDDYYNSPASSRNTSARSVAETFPLVEPCPTMAVTRSIRAKYAESYNTATHTRYPLGRTYCDQVKIHACDFFPKRFGHRETLHTQRSLHTAAHMFQW
ncbi:hypothetical protein pipiens_016260 [Culex pipiens pipiens]|uniref:Uncharacterized protein n=1 Tax=Culex pipiens pipiens TaxID=38569 RepID=A0ABD1CM13_CULPP